MWQNIKLINIWAAKNTTQSLWHFDAYLNFNYIIKVILVLALYHIIGKEDILSCIAKLKACLSTIDIKLVF